MIGRAPPMVLYGFHVYLDHGWRKAAGFDLIGSTEVQKGLEQHRALTGLAPATQPHCGEPCGGLRGPLGEAGWPSSSSAVCPPMDKSLLVEPLSESSRAHV